MVRDVYKIYAEINSPNTVRQLQNQDLSSNTIIVGTGEARIITTSGIIGQLTNRIFYQTGGGSIAGLALQPNSVLCTDGGGNLTWRSR